MGQIPDLHSCNSSINCQVTMLAEDTSLTIQRSHTHRDKIDPFQSNCCILIWVKCSVNTALPQQDYALQCESGKKPYTKRTSVVKIVCYCERIRTRTYLHLTHITNKHVNDSIPKKTRSESDPCVVSLGDTWS